MLGWLSQTVRLRVPHNSSIISTNIILPNPTALGATHPISQQREDIRLKFPRVSLFHVTSRALSRPIGVSPSGLHSHLCTPAGILHKGTGENQFLTQQPAIITSIMGNGRRRSISCPSCNGLAEGNKLLAPVALAVGVDGSLFVGDFNYIRRIYPSRNVTSILELR